MGMAGVVGRSCSKLGQAAQFHMAHIIILIITSLSLFLKMGSLSLFLMMGYFSAYVVRVHTTASQYKVCPTTKLLKVFYVSFH